MTQEGIITNIYPNGMAEVVVQRGTACGGNCGSCEACAYQNELKSLARNPLAARRGQRVMIETRTSAIMKAAALVYVMPLILMIAAYFIVSALGAAEGLCILASFIGLVIGAVIIVKSQRRKGKKNEITFEIVQILEN